MTIIRNGSQENHLLQAALGYAKRGWRVMPLHGISGGQCTCLKRGCGSAGKHPQTRHGRKDATNDQSTIIQWWATWPTANVGIATGPESGFFMLGPDGQAGIDALADLQRLHEQLPRTPLLRSGGGGQHYYFAWPDEGDIKTGANVHGLPIDVRGAGGLVVAPPSMHASGNSYFWEITPDEVQLAAAPAWLLEWLRSGQGSRKRRKADAETKFTNQSPPNADISSFHTFVPGEPRTNGKVVFTVEADRGTNTQARAVAYLTKCSPAISGKGGHNQTFEVARAIAYGFDLGSVAAFDLLQQHYNPRCVPPWTDAELKHKCDEADTKPFDKPRGHLLREDEHPGPGSSPPPPLSIAGEDIEALPMSPPAPWPELPTEALHGLVGEIVTTLTPETESDPVAILGQMLVAFGNAVGRSPHYTIEGDSHHANLFLCLVGESSRGRKGTSRGRVMQLMRYADDTWCQERVAGGMSSGEGLIWFVRDPIEQKEPIKEKGRVVGYQTVVVDEGVSDKRFLADESEFAQVLKVLQRQGNSLSPVIRQCWDTGQLRTLTKNSPARATGAHTSIWAHIARPELASLLKATEAFNGFANRFLWLCVRRSQLLPDGGRALDLSHLGNRLKDALEAARVIGAMTRSEPACRLWRQMYPQLTAERGGLYGGVTGRAEAQVLRLSMVYALLDGSSVIEDNHLRAALAFWDYADASARLIFGAESEDPLIDLVLAKLQEAGDAGMSRTELHHAFSRNIPAVNLLAALAKLRDRGDARSETIKTGRPGAPAERWLCRRRNELNESTRAVAAPRTSEEIDSFSSSVRRHSSDTAVSGEEVTP